MLYRLRWRTTYKLIDFAQWIHHDFAHKLVDFARWIQPNDPDWTLDSEHDS